MFVAAVAQRGAYRSDMPCPRLILRWVKRWLTSRRSGLHTQHGGLSMAAAFNRLRDYARTHNNTRLSEVARQVNETNLATEVLAAPAV